MTSKSPFVQGIGRLLTKALAGTVNRSLVKGVKGTSITGVRESKLREISEKLLASGRFYSLGNCIFFEDNTPSLIQILRNMRVMKNAGALFSAFAVEGYEVDEPLTKPLSDKLLLEVFNTDYFRSRVPVINYYSWRPCYGEVGASFVLLKPGYNESCATLLHCEGLVPIAWCPPRNPTSVLDTLPPVTREIFRDFAFETEIDRLHGFSMLLTGFLVNIFTPTGKPFFILDGNKESVGKTLFAQTISVILDDKRATIIETDNDGEMSKQLATFLPSKKSIVFLDNLKSKIGGVFLEARVLEPEIELRLLHTNDFVYRPNDFLWVATANGAVATPDMASRSVVIKFEIIGDAKTHHNKAVRTHEGLLNYAKENRMQILAELAGIFEFWISQGCPRVPAEHRCTKWASLIGGILSASGLGGFLTNQTGLRQAIDDNHEKLQSFLSYVSSRSGLVGRRNEKRPAAWLPIFHNAMNHARIDITVDNASIMGRWLSSNIGKVVEIEMAGGVGSALINRRAGPGSSNLYWVEVPGNDCPSLPGCDDGE